MGEKKLIFCIIICVIILLIIFIMYWRRNAVNELSPNLNSTVSTENLNYDIDIPEIERSKDKVKMTIKEGTLTRNGATVIIHDDNENPYIYGNDYLIYRMEENEWKLVEPIDPDYIVDAIALMVDPNTHEIEFDIDWSKVFGELENGRYMLVKELDYQDYITVEFNIE